MFVGTTLSDAGSLRIAIDALDRGDENFIANLHWSIRLDWQMDLRMSSKAAENASTLSDNPASWRYQC